jgi:hypothetical protein
MPKAIVKEKTWAPDEIEKLLQTSDNMVMRSVVQIFNKQTEYEKTEDRTKERNGVGFNGFDAEFGTSIAKKVIAGRELTPKQIHFSRKMIMKYTKQLTKIANREI